MRAKCPVHCYQRDRREQAREVMRYAGPRMVWQSTIVLGGASFF